MSFTFWLVSTAVLGLAATAAAACSRRCVADAATLAREVPLFFRGTPVEESVAGGKRSYVTR